MAGSGTGAGPDPPVGGYVKRYAIDPHDVVKRAAPAVKQEFQGVAVKVRGVREVAGRQG
ncbi:hypothetical protein GSbR_01050 [Geobacter sp. SVR]|nr:hypothetical protein GSVR_38100 [Geobacter sp. SVR]GCF83505.1 hypothetical protein GSbR_01050 [Geobacter sp. SVR]